MKAVIIDNYDSFTYNLYHLIRETGTDTTVLRNDAFDLKDIEAYDKIILSPGPGIPEEAGLLLDDGLPSCLEVTAIGQAFGAQLVNLSDVFHGVQSPCFHTEKDYIFQGIPKQFPVGRYHSWVVSDDGLPSCLEVTAVSPEGQIMALRHREYDIHGIQFHPESVLTPNGRAIVENFLGHTLCP